MITLYWCKKHGQFVDKETGEYLSGARFRGTTVEWYETLNETIVGISYATGANSLLCGPHIRSILESTVLFKSVPANVHDLQFGVIANRIAVFEPGLRAIPVNEIWILKDKTPVARIVVLELGVL